MERATIWLNNFNNYYKLCGGVAIASVFVRSVRSIYPLRFSKQSLPHSLPFDRELAFPLEGFALWLSYLLRLLLLLLLLLLRL